MNARWRAKIAQAPAVADRNQNMSIRLIRLALYSVAILPMAAASAAPSITPLGEADKHGALVYSVKCDNGVKKILQCVRDDRHCGYAGDTPLAALVSEVCDGKAPAAAAPESSDDSTPFQTSPANP